MKHTLFYILFFSIINLFSQVQSEIDTSSIRIGEQFEYKISIDQIENVIIPKLELKGLEVVDSSKIDTLKNRLVKKYLLTGFDSGAYYIPQQQIFIKNQLYLTDSLLVNVATIAVDTTKIKKFPIKGIKEEPYQLADFKHYLWWILAALILLGVLVYFFVFRKKKEREEQVVISKLTAYEEALEKLQQLDKKLLWQNNKIKEYYSELIEIVRGYIERELKVPALEKTTDEIIETLVDFKGSETIEISKETIQTLQRLLQEADLVKFAKSKPLANEIEQDRKSAEEVINHLKSKPIANSASSSQCIVTGEEETDKIKLYKWGYIVFAFTLTQKEIPISLLGKNIHIFNQSIFWNIFNSFGTFFLRIPIFGGTIMVIWAAIVIPFLIVISIIELILTGSFLNRGIVYLKSRGELKVKKLNKSQISIFREEIKSKLDNKRKAIRFAKYLSIILPILYVLYIVYLFLSIDK